MVFTSLFPLNHLLKTRDYQANSFNVTFLLLKSGRNKIVKQAQNLTHALLLNKNTNMLLFALLIITLKQLHQQSTCKNFFFISSKIFCLHLQNTSYGIQRTKWITSYFFKINRRDSEIRTIILKKFLQIKYVIIFMVLYHLKFSW